jgi:hypothetical protein
MVVYRGGKPLRSFKNGTRRCAFFFARQKKRPTDYRQAVSFLYHNSSVSGKIENAVAICGGLRGLLGILSKHVGHLVLQVFRLFNLSG